METEILRALLKWFWKSPIYEANSVLVNYSMYELSRTFSTSTTSQWVLTVLYLLVDKLPVIQNLDDCFFSWYPWWLHIIYIAPSWNHLVAMAIRKRFWWLNYSQSSSSVLTRIFNTQGSTGPIEKLKGGHEGENRVTHSKFYSSELE